MRTEISVVRVGECVGPIDWEYDFRRHFDKCGTSDRYKDEFCNLAIDQLKVIESAFKAGHEIKATTDGGWPKFGYYKVIDVGMYDGWPYWKPTPSICTLSPLGGGEWHSFDMITDIRQGEQR